MGDSQDWGEWMGGSLAQWSRAQVLEPDRSGLGSPDSLHLSEAQCPHLYIGADQGGFLAGWEPGLNAVPQASSWHMVNLQ